MTTTKTDLIAAIRAAGCTLADSTLKRKPVSSLEDLLFDLQGGHRRADPSREKAALPADEPAQADSTPEAENTAPDATFTARGNYNTVWVPIAETLAPADVNCWTEKESAMVVHVHVAGDDAASYVARLEALTIDAHAALRTWQKSRDRKGQTEMEKYNQNRSFLAGYGAAFARNTPAITFAKDMDKALRPEARAAGVAAGKSA